MIAMRQPALSLLTIFSLLSLSHSGSDLLAQRPNSARVAQPGARTGVPQGGRAPAGVNPSVPTGDRQKVIIRRPVQESVEIDGITVKAGSIVVAREGAIVRRLTKAERLDKGHTVKVRKISEDWLWVRGNTIAGWVHKLDVIPFEKAVADIAQVIRMRKELSGTVPKGRSVVEGYARGNELLSSGDYDAAIAKFTQVIQQNPEIADAYNSRGDALLGKQDYDTAIDDFTEATTHDPQHHVAYYNRGYAWHMKQEIDRALMDYNKAIDIEPNEPWYYLQRGLCWYEKGEKKKAFEDHETFVKTAPKTVSRKIVIQPPIRVTQVPAPIVQTPVFYGDAGDADSDTFWSPEELDEAIANFSEAIKLNPKFAMAYNGRGWAKYRKKQFSDAAADFDIAILLAEKGDFDLDELEIADTGNDLPESTKNTKSERTRPADLFPQ